MLFTESVANAPAAQVALDLGCKGPNVTVTQGEASALLAVAEGAWLVRSGRVRRALVGGVEELSPLLHAILDRHGALAGSRFHADDSGDEQARPLDLRRCGCNAAEGAAVLVLERATDLERRGGRARGWVGPCVRAFDPSAPVTGWSERAPATAERLCSEWRRHGWLEQLSGVVSGASGSRAGDRLEAFLVGRALEQANPGQAIELPVVTPKGFLGEQGMATLVGSLLLFEGLATGAQNTFVADPKLGLRSHRGVVAGGRFLLSAVAAGGSCCWLGLESG